MYWNRAVDLTKFIENNRKEEARPWYDEARNQLSQEAYEAIRTTGKKEYEKWKASFKPFVYVEFAEHNSQCKRVAPMVTGSYYYTQNGARSLENRESERVRKRLSESIKEMEANGDLYKYKINFACMVLDAVIPQRARPQTIKKWVSKAFMQKFLDDDSYVRFQFQKKLRILVTELNLNKKEVNECIDKVIASQNTGALFGSSSNTFHIPIETELTEEDFIDAALMDKWVHYFNIFSENEVVDVRPKLSKVVGSAVDWEVEFLVGAYAGETFEEAFSKFLANNRAKKLTHLSLMQLTRTRLAEKWVANQAAFWGNAQNRMDMVSTSHWAQTRRFGEKRLYALKRKMIKDYRLEIFDYTKIKNGTLEDLYKKVIGKARALKLTPTQFETMVNSKKLPSRQKQY